MPSWRGVQLKNRDNFTFTFTNKTKYTGLGGNKFGKTIEEMA
jgi:hypothetical protein